MSIKADLYSKLDSEWVYLYEDMKLNVKNKGTDNMKDDERRLMYPMVIAFASALANMLKHMDDMKEVVNKLNNIKAEYDNKYRLLTTILAL